MAQSSPSFSARALPPPQRAAYATATRLLSCLITESLVRALYVPVQGVEAQGFGVVLKPGVDLDAPYTAADVLVIIPLRHLPIFKHEGKDPRAKEIGLLDRLEMMPPLLQVLQVDDTSRPGSESASHVGLAAALLRALNNEPGWDLTTFTQFTVNEGPRPIWNAYAQAANLEPVITRDIGEELVCSVKWQTHAFENPPLAPTFESPSIDWEQSSVEGHPIHPMHKTRNFLPPLPDFAPGSYDLDNPKLRFVALPRSDLKTTFNFEELTRPLLDAASERAGKLLKVREDYLVIPVLELQVPHIQDKFSDAEIYPEEFNLELRAQQSIRTVIVPGVYRELCLKLSIGMRVTSSIRAISPEMAHLGPRFSAQIVQVLDLDPELLVVAKELASVVHIHPDREIARHCSAIIRECHENTSEERGERFIVCSSLVQTGHAGDGGDIPPVTRIFDLDTEDKRAAWFDRFTAVFFQALLPPVLKYGVGFECHLQNCVARFDLKTKEIKGFMIRDIGGVRIHPPSLRKATGLDMDFTSGGPAVVEDIGRVYNLAYNTMIHNNLQQFVRALDLHYSGRGWRIIRKNLENIIPKTHSLWDRWMSPAHTTLPGKCFLKMRIAGTSDAFGDPIFNLLHYDGEGIDVI